jgi:hypothetical protein
MGDTCDKIHKMYEHKDKGEGIKSSLFTALLISGLLLGKMENNNIMNERCSLICMIMKVSV